MTVLDLGAILVSLAAVFAWFNHRYLGLPATLGVMLLALATSAAIMLADFAGAPGISDWAESALAGIDFSAVVLEGMLSFLLFAGALFVDLGKLRERRYLIGLLATVGVVVSTTLVALMGWGLAGWMGLGIPFVWWLVFGALISPTDPIAVLGVLKTAGVPKALETKIVGESLFNDGVAVVVFLVLLGVATGGAVNVTEVGGLFLQEAVGGAVFGLLLGFVAHRLLAGIDQYQVEILITLAVVMGGYAAALAMHLAGPIAMVFAGLVIGHHRRKHAMSLSTREHLNQFWELIDEILNVVLFVLIGLEVLVLDLDWRILGLTLVLIPVVLVARLASVSLPVMSLRAFRSFTPGTIPVLTWGGLRGAISVALVLSLPAGAIRDTLLPVTYGIVLFSLLAQGLTIGPLARRLAGRERALSGDDSSPSPGNASENI